MADLKTTGYRPHKESQCDNMDEDFIFFMADNPRFYVCDFSDVLDGVIVSFEKD